MTVWAQTLFATEFMYGLLVPLAKTPIFLLYLRLFRVHRWFRITTYVLIAYVWAWGISETMVSVVQCRPIAYQWNKTIEGSCIDQLTYYRWVRVPNAIHDVVMLVMPAPVVWRLKIDIRRKVALTSVFLIGSMWVPPAVLRPHYLLILNPNKWLCRIIHLHVQFLPDGRLLGQDLGFDSAHALDTCRARDHFRLRMRALTLATAAPASPSRHITCRKLQKVGSLG